MIYLHEHTEEIRRKKRKNEIFAATYYSLSGTHSGVLLLTYLHNQENSLFVSVSLSEFTKGRVGIGRVKITGAKVIVHEANTSQYHLKIISSPYCAVSAPYNNVCKHHNTLSGGIYAIRYEPHILSLRCFKFSFQKQFQ